MLTIEPLPHASMRGSTARHMTKVLVRFTAMVLEYCSTVVAGNGPRMSTR